MDNGDFGISKREVYEYITKSRKQGKRETARKINVGTAYYDALETPQGKILLKGYEEILADKFSKIIGYRHQEKMSIEENYNNLMFYISSYNAVEKTGEVWASKLKELGEAVKEIKKATAEI